MLIKPPTADEYAALASKHSHRFPGKFTVTVLGDGGLPTKIPIVLGNPSGACELPHGEKPSPAWSRTVGVALTFIKDAPEVGQALARDCVLFPDVEGLDALLERWPGLPDRLLVEVRRKIGGSREQLEEAAYDEKPPEPIAAALLQAPRAVWRRLRPMGEELLVAVEPPPQVSWQIFMEEMRKSGADYAENSFKMAASCVRAAQRMVDKKPAAIAVDAMLRQWPGTAIMVLQVITELVGLVAEVERDGW